MITRLEATRYRCFERLGIDVSDFRVLVGANGQARPPCSTCPCCWASCCARTTWRPPFWSGGPILRRALAARPIDCGRGIPRSGLGRPAPAPAPAEAQPPAADLGDMDDDIPF